MAFGPQKASESQSKRGEIDRSDVLLCVLKTPPATNLFVANKLQAGGLAILRVLRGQETGLVAAPKWLATKSR
ncbi:MAG: hypothetical protein SynsKO_25610 [Synoicihabitans sp.]